MDHKLLAEPISDRSNIFSDVDCKYNLLAVLNILKLYGLVKIFYNNWHSKQ